MTDRRHASYWLIAVAIFGIVEGSVAGIVLGLAALLAFGLESALLRKPEEPKRITGYSDDAPFRVVKRGQR